MLDQALLRQTMPGPNLVYANLVRHDRLADDLKPLRRAADAIEASSLAYTIVRPAGMTDEDEVDYETTTRHAPFSKRQICTCTPAWA